MHAKPNRFVIWSIVVIAVIFIWNMSARTKVKNRNVVLTTMIVDRRQVVEPPENKTLDVPPLPLEHVIYRVSRLPPDELTDRGLAPLTKWTQREIFRRMNPANCSSAKFLLTESNVGSGIGSSLHVMGTHLAYAIENNLVLAWGPNSCRHMPGKHKNCRNFFMEITGCAEEDIAKNTIGSVEGQAHRTLVPGVFRRAIAPFMNNEREILYWWRAQSIGYIGRINSNTMATVLNMRRDTSLHFYSGGVLPFPLPVGTVSAHIRHGDKHTEMRLVDTVVFYEAAKKMALLQPLSFGGKNYFVTSDSQLAIDSSRGLLSPDWKIAYSNVIRERNGFVMSEWELSSNVTTYNHLLQLLMALEADAWVGTRGSNWNRLIDELRCIWVDKCMHVYTEVGDIGGGDYSW